MLSNKRYSIARETGRAVATSNFIMMLNPKFRGPKFQLDNLYNIANGFARSTVGLQGNFGKDQKEMEEIAAEAAKFELNRLFEESGVKEWLKLE